MVAWNWMSADGYKEALWDDGNTLNFVNVLKTIDL